MPLMPTFGDFSPENVAKMFGKAVYYSLESVKQRLIIECQTAAKEIALEIKKLNLFENVKNVSETVKSLTENTLNSSLSTLNLLANTQNLFENTASFTEKPQVVKEKSQNIKENTKNFTQRNQNTTEISQNVTENPQHITESSQNVTRAVIVYLPPNKAEYSKQFKALYLSIAVMRSHQPPHIKTDLIVYTEKTFMELPMSYGCIQVFRESFNAPESCIVLDHVPVSKRGPLVDGVIDPLEEYSNYIESVLILEEFQGRQYYDYLIRVDLDTFLTPGFGSWLPPKPSTLVVGNGGYGSNNANAHLKWIITQKLGLNDTGTTSFFYRVPSFQPPSMVCISVIIHSQLSRCSTARGSSSGLSLGSPTKV